MLKKLMQTAGMTGLMALGACDDLNKEESARVEAIVQPDMTLRQAREALITNINSWACKSDKVGVAEAIVAERTEHLPELQDTYGCKTNKNVIDQKTYNDQTLDLAQIKDPQEVRQFIDAFVTLVKMEGDRAEDECKDKDIQGFTEIVDLRKEVLADMGKNGADISLEESRWICSNNKAEIKTNFKRGETLPRNLKVTPIKNGIKYDVNGNTIIVSQPKQKIEITGGAQIKNMFVI